MTICSDSSGWLGARERIPLLVIETYWNAHNFTRCSFQMFFSTNSTQERICGVLWGHLEKTNDVLYRFCVFGKHPGGSPRNSWGRKQSFIVFQSTLGWVCQNQGFKFDVYENVLWSRMKESCNWHFGFGHSCPTPAKETSDKRFHDKTLPVLPNRCFLKPLTHEQSKYRCHW